MKPMADIPDIIIRNAEERKAKLPYLLVEVRFPEGVKIREVVEVKESSPWWKQWGYVDRDWWFADRESLHLFAAALVRNYRREGVRATRNHCSQYEHCYDNRTEQR